MTLNPVTAIYLHSQPLPDPGPVVLHFPVPVPSLLSQAAPASLHLPVLVFSTHTIVALAVIAAVPVSNVIKRMFTILFFIVF
jgi:hypothetical protein